MFLIETLLVEKTIFSCNQKFIYGGGKWSWMELHARAYAKIEWIWAWLPVERANRVGKRKKTLKWINGNELDVLKVKLWRLAGVWVDQMDQRNELKEWTKRMN